MNEPNKQRMIPLHIADQAVAACNAEIVKLQEDNARLKASIERLTEAGDAVCESPYALETDPAIIAWRAAKQANHYEA
jgi:hypothetical protein